jgi:hypothetical protein
MQRTYVVLACLAGAAPALAQPAPPAPMNPEAKLHLDRGVDHFKRREYAEAKREFLRGFWLDPRPEFLYALGQVQRVQGDCAAAISFFEEFLRRPITPEQAEAARLNIARCRAQLGPPKEPATGGAPTAPPPAAEIPSTRKGDLVLDLWPTAPSGETRAPPPRGRESASEAATQPAAAASLPASQPHGPGAPTRWRHSVVGTSLCATGVATVVAGVVLWQVGRGAVSDAAAAWPYNQFVQRVGEARAGETRQTVGVTVAAVGGALVASGVLVYLLLPRRASASETVAAAPVPGGVVFAVHGRR